MAENRPYTKFAKVHHAKVLRARKLAKQAQLSKN